jgi:hypothetical protein
MRGKNILYLRKEKVNGGIIMENAVIEAIKGQGAWAVLFAVLLIWVLKENAKREGKYQSIIDKLSEKFEIIEKGIVRIEDKVDDWFKGR